VSVISATPPSWAIVGTGEGIQADVRAAVVVNARTRERFGKSMEQQKDPFRRAIFVKPTRGLEPRPR
jgi:hypothetical protein